MYVSVSEFNSELVSDCDGKWLFIVSITVIIKWCHYVHIFVSLKGSNQIVQ